MATNKEYAEQVAAEIIKRLQEGTAPWQKPWEPGELSAPYNAQTGKAYRGFNSVWLGMFSHHDDPRWLTYKQAEAMGAQVRKGEKGVQLVYFSTSGRVPEKDDQGRPVKGEDGKQKYTDVTLMSPIMKRFTVFNASQIDGLPELVRPERSEPGPRHAQAERIMAGSGVPIQHRAGDRAYYSPREDKIVLPTVEQFKDMDSYYATAMHELGHSTGHKSRLDRDLTNPFGSQGYAKEELRAEIASLMIGQQIGLGHDPEQHAAYVGSWIKALQEDPQEIFRASADAQKITEMVMGWDLELEHENEIEQEPIRIGERVTFTAYDKGDPLSVGTVEGMVIDAQPTNSGNVRYRIQTDKIAPQGGDLLETLVYSDQGTIQRSGEKTVGIGTEAHYSDKTLQALIENHGWEMAYSGLHQPGRMDAVRRTFEGVGPLGTQTTPNGERNLQVGYTADPEQRRYAALTLGDTTVADLDGRDADPEQIASLINLKAEQWADEKRQSRGLEPIYAPDSKPLELVSGNPEKLREEAAEVARYDAARGKVPAPERNDPEAKLRAIWQAQGVNKERQDQLIAEIEEKAKPGAQIGPFFLPDPERDQVIALNAKAIEADEAFSAELVRVYGKDKAGDARYQLKHEDEGVNAARAKRQEAVEQWHKAADALRESRQAQAQTRQEQDPRPVLVENGEKAMERTWLNVPYAEKNQAKAQGARWDREARSWYAPEGTDLGGLKKWIEKPAIQQEGPAVELAAALRAAGLQIEGLPVMDGTRQRVPVEGDKGKEVSGSYMAWSDGHPAASIQNYKTGLKENWKWSGTSQTVGDVQRSELEKEHQERMAQKEREREARYAERAVELGEALKAGKDYTPADPTHAYLAAKDLAGVALDPGIKQDQRGNLIVPATDIEGNVQTVQWIGRGGAKGFAAGAKMQGAMHIHGQTESGPIVIGEGWATMETIHRATGAMAVTAFTEGNVGHVAQAIREKWPERPIVIAGDNDHRREAQGHRNPGVESAKAAAKAVGGHAAIPAFGVDSNGSDWNDWAKEHGKAALAKSMAESMLIADRRRLEDAMRLGTDAERVAQNVRDHQAQVEHALSGADGGIRGNYAEQRQKANVEVDEQDRSDQQPKEQVKHDQQQQKTREQKRDKDGREERDQVREAEKDVATLAAAVGLTAGRNKGGRGLSR